MRGKGTANNDKCCCCNEQDVLLEQNNGFQPLLKLGSNPEIDSGLAETPADIWTQGIPTGTLLYPFPAAAGDLTVESTDAADSSALGTGAEEVSLYWQDASFVETFSESILLDGVTPVVIQATTPFRFYRAFVSAGVANIGQLIFRIGGTIVGTIEIGSGQTEMAIYTIPATLGDPIKGQGAISHARLFNINASVLPSGSNGAVGIDLNARPAGGIWQVKDTFVVDNTQSLQKSYPDGLRFEVGTDLRVTVTSASADDMAVAADFQLRNYFSS